MPPGIHHTETAEGSHQYQIRNAFTRHLYEFNETSEQLAERLRGAFPAALEIAEKVEIKIDLKNSTFALVAPRKLSSEEITQLLRFLVGSRLIPSWHELIARESPPTKLLIRKKFTAKSTDSESTPSLEWSERARFEPLNRSIKLGKNHLGTMELTPTNRYCMCHSYFTFRILDRDGGVVWKSPAKLLRGIMRVSISDLNDDHWQEIWIECDDHSETKIVKIERQIR